MDITSDMSELDALLGDGIEQGSSTLVPGPAGSGQISLGCRTIPCRHVVTKSSQQRASPLRRGLRCNPASTGATQE
jgi:hypothetical protein